MKKYPSRNKKLLISIFALMAIMSFILYKIIFFNKGIEVSIENSTSTQLSNFRLSYTLGENDIEFPTIKKKSIEKLMVSPKENFKNSNLKLIYNDATGKEQAIYLLKDFSKSTSCKIVIKITPDKAKGFTVDYKTLFLTSNK